MQDLKKIPVYINKKFDEKLLLGFSNTVENIHEKACFQCYFNSYGGYVGILNKISKIMKNHVDRYDSWFIAYIHRAYSAALDLTQNMHHRYIIPTSEVALHFPDFNTIQHRIISEKEKKYVRKTCIQYYTQRTKLTEDDIITLDNVVLYSGDIIRYGLADELIKKF